MRTYDGGQFLNRHPLAIDGEAFGHRLTGLAGRVAAVDVEALPADDEAGRSSLETFQERYERHAVP